MKNLLVLLLVGCSIISCSKKSEFEPCILEFLNKSAMGLKIEYDFKEISIKESVKVSSLVEDFYKSLEFDKSVSPDTVISKLDDYLSEPESVSDYDVWKFRSDRFKEMQKRDADDIAYNIVLGIHEFNNPLVNNAKVEVKRFYIIDKCKVLAYIDADNFSQKEKENSKTPFTKYEVAILEKQ